MTGSGHFKEVFPYPVWKNHACWRTFYPQVLMKMPRISQEIIFMVILDKEGVLHFKPTFFCQVT